MTDSPPPPRDDAAPAVSGDQLHELQTFNDALDEQVKLLVRTEQRLYRSQNQVDRQLARVQGLSDYVLACSSLATPQEILAGAATLLADQFLVDRVQILEAIVSDTQVILQSPSASTVVVCPEERRFVVELSAPTFLRAGEPGPYSRLMEALDRADREQGRAADTEQAAILPVRAIGKVQWLMVTRRFAGRPGNLFMATPGEEHIPFLMLLVGHVERALENERLNHDLREQAAQLEHSNEKLKASLGDLARTQHHLIQASKMEALGRLAGGVAHDFNNLLTVVLGTARVMETDERLEEDLREDCQAVIQAAERAAELTRQMLTFGRRRPGRARRFELHPVLTELSKLLRRIIGEDVELELRLDASHDELLADPAQLEQVLMNLVLNARDAMPHGGSVVVSTTVEADPQQPMLQMSVTDTGRGMDSPTRARVFEPFFTTKDTGDGSGMGLATVYGIVKQLGGQVQVDSVPGEGSRFELSLPLAGPPARKTESPDGIPSTTVLVVEDEGAIRRLVVKILGRHGYEVVAAPDGETGLRRFAECGEVDLVLTDVVMPGLDGVRMVQQLRKRRPDLPVLFMSGYSGDHHRGIPDDDRAMMLDKPFTPAQLVERVERALVIRGVGQRAP